MARSKTPTHPPPRKLTPEDMRAGITRLERRIAEVQAFAPELFEGDDSELSRLRASVDDALERTFGLGTTEYYRYGDASTFSYTMNFAYPVKLQEKRADLDRCKRNSLALLHEAVRSLKEQLEEIAARPVTVVASGPKAQELSDKVFIVHGHDNEAKQTVARFVTDLGLKPIILHEQASQSRTIIEKLESHSDVGFAVVLLTPDDEGRAKGEDDLKERARQNVVAELGYFVGHLKRNKVCALVKGKIEIPSDFSGVVYVPFESASNHWKVELARELRAAGYAIKMEAILGA